MLKQRILIVDDEKFLRELMADILCRNGFDTIALEDGVSVLSLLEADQDFDLVISDVQMPRMNGIVLCQEIRQLYPHIPVLVTSVHSSQSIIDSVLREGADYLPRPFSAKNLLEMVRNILSRSNRISTD
jgi:DNA-binding response OmpR family regulator